MVDVFLGFHVLSVFSASPSLFTLGSVFVVEAFRCLGTLSCPFTYKHELLDGCSVLVTCWAAAGWLPRAGGPRSARPQSFLPVSPEGGSLTPAWAEAVVGAEGADVPSHVQTFLPPAPHSSCAHLP